MSFTQSIFPARWKIQFSKIENEHVSLNKNLQIKQKTETMNKHYQEKGGHFQVELIFLLVQKEMETMQKHLTFAVINKINE